jgi:hypothetical protein
MLSYDYCHFEISLSNEASTVAAANELRKTAQRLADEAVRQYKQAKDEAKRRCDAECMLPGLRREVDEILLVPVDERSPRQNGTVKALEDAEFAANKRYQYDDDTDFGDEPF